MDATSNEVVDYYTDTNGLCDDGYNKIPKELDYANNLMFSMKSLKSMCIPNKGEPTYCNNIYFIQCRCRDFNGKPRKGRDDRKN